MWSFLEGPAVAAPSPLLTGRSRVLCWAAQQHSCPRAASTCVGLAKLTPSHATHGISGNRRTITLTGVLYQPRVVWCASRENTVWSIQITSVAGLGFGMGSAPSLKKAAEIAHHAVRGLAPCSASHSRAEWVYACSPRDAQQQGKHRTDPATGELWTRIRSYPLSGLFSPVNDVTCALLKW